MSNAKIAEMLDAALIEHAQRMRAAVDASLKAMASAMARDIVELRNRVAILEQAATATDPEITVKYPDHAERCAEYEANQADAPSAENEDTGSEGIPLK